MTGLLRRWWERYFHDEEALLLLLLIAGGMLLMGVLGAVLAPVLAAIVLAYLLQGPIGLMRRYRVPHPIAIALTFLLFVGALAAALLVVLPLAWNQLLRLTDEIPGMLARGQELLLLLPEKYPGFFTEAQVQGWIQDVRAEVGEFGQLLLGYSLGYVNSLVTLTVYLVLVPTLVFFFLKDERQISGWVVARLPAERPLINRVLHEMDIQIAGYVRGKVVEILIVGGASYVTFALFGLNYAALLAIAVGFSVVVPYIGAAVVTVPVALVAYFQWGLEAQFVYLLIAYGVLQALDGNLLVPLLFSEAVNLHPVLIILAVLVFGSFWGFWGVFFAIPLATLFKAVFTAWPRAVREFEGGATETDGDAPFSGPGVRSSGRDHEAG